MDPWGHLNVRNSLVLYIFMRSRRKAAKFSSHNFSNIGVTAGWGGGGGAGVEWGERLNQTDLGRVKKTFHVFKMHAKKNTCPTCTRSAMTSNAVHCGQRVTITKTFAR